MCSFPIYLVFQHCHLSDKNIDTLENHYCDLLFRTAEDITMHVVLMKHFFKIF